MIFLKIPWSVKVVCCARTMGRLQQTLWKPLVITELSLRFFLTKRVFCNQLLRVRDTNRLKTLIKKHVLSLGLTEILSRVWVRWGNYEQCLSSPHALHACWKAHSATGWFNHAVIGRATDGHSVHRQTPLPRTAFVHDIIYTHGKNTYSVHCIFCIQSISHFSF